MRQHAVLQVQNLYFWLNYLKYGPDEFNRASIKLVDPPQLEPFSDISYLMQESQGQ